MEVLHLSSEGAGEWRRSVLSHLSLTYKHQIHRRLQLTSRLQIEGCKIGSAIVEITHYKIFAGLVRASLVIQLRAKNIYFRLQQLDDVTWQHLRRLIHSLFKQLSV